MVSPSSCYPATVAEALDALDAGFQPYAGGTDLMLKKQRPDDPPPFCFLGRIPELKDIITIDGELRVGPLVTVAELATHPSIPALLQQGCLAIGSPGLRNAATLGGNICTASPAGDSLPPLYALDAQVVLKSRSGKRKLPIREFIRGPGSTALGAGELLVSVCVPELGPSHHRFLKVSSRVANAISKVTLAGFLQEKERSITRISVAFGAVGPTIIRCHALEEYCLGKNRETLLSNPEQLAQYIKSGIQPIDDHRSSIQYREETAIRLFEHFLASAGSSSPVVD